MTRVVHLFPGLMDGAVSHSHRVALFVLSRLQRSASPYIPSLKQIYNQLQNGPLKL